MFEEVAPSSKEVLRYAGHLGIAEDDRDLLLLAEEALCAPLPSDAWTQHFQDGMIPYYHNDQSGESTYTHPLEQHFMDRVIILGNLRTMLRDSVAAEESLTATVHIAFKIASTLNSHSEKLQAALKREEQRAAEGHVLAPVL